MKKEVIGVNLSNKGLINLPLELKKKSAAIVFYSSLNSPKDLAMIFSEYKLFKEIIYIDMEDFEATDIALYDFSAQVPNRKGIEEIVDFIDKLLTYDHQLRPTAKEAMDHPFFTMKCN